MIVKTSELSGAALDWLVARAEGKERDCEVHASNVWYGRATSGYVQYRPSTKWEQGGPLIARERIDCISDPNGTAGWMGRTWVGGQEVRMFGSTPLIAAMRCYVAIKLGDEVDAPGGLLP